MLAAGTEDEHRKERRIIPTVANRFRGFCISSTCYTNTHGLAVNSRRNLRRKCWHEGLQWLNVCIRLGKVLARRTPVLSTYSRYPIILIREALYYQRSTLVAILYHPFMFHSEIELPHAYFWVSISLFDEMGLHRAHIYVFTHSLSLSQFSRLHRLNTY